jgi:hypothetical protein
MNTVELLPAIRDLYSRHPECRHLQAWELQHVLWSLHCTEDLEDKGDCRRGGRRTPGLARVEDSMTDRRDEERERTRRERDVREGDERRREHVERRFDDLKESWRRNHPSEPEEGGKGRPRKGRPR